MATTEATSEISIPRQEKVDDDEVYSSEASDPQESQSQLEPNDKSVHVDKVDANNRHLKKTCEACVRSKVRCEGGGRPCERCIKRGIDCVFMQEQKRGRRPGPLANSETRKRQSLNVMHRSPKNAKHDEPLKPTDVKPESSNIALVDANGSRRYLAGSHQDATQPSAAYNFGYPAMGQSLTPAMTQLQHVILANHARFSQPAYWGASPLMQSYPPSFMGLGMGNSASNNALYGFLSDVERRTIRSLFALFKHHFKGHSCDPLTHAWFGSRFSFLWYNMRGRISPEDYNAFTFWMMKYDFHPKGPVALVPTNPCLAGLALSDSPPPQAGVKLGTIHIYHDSRVECDNSFTASMGYTSDDFLPRNGWPSCALLPWGAEVVAALVSNDEDVFGYITLVTAKASSAKAAPGNTVRTSCIKSLMLMQKSGLPINCNIFADVLELVVPEGRRLQGVTLHFFLASTTQPLQQKQREKDIGPWSASVSSLPRMGGSWLTDILNWA